MNTFCATFRAAVENTGALDPVLAAYRSTAYVSPMLGAFLFVQLICLARCCVLVPLLAGACQVRIIQVGYVTQYGIIEGTQKPAQ